MTLLTDQKVGGSSPSKRAKWLPSDGSAIAGVG